MKPEKDFQTKITKGTHQLNRMLRFVAFLIPVFILPATTYAAKTSYSGLSGLVFINTADTLSKGELNFNVREGAERFVQNGVTDHVGRSAIGLSYGVVNGLEVAAQVPHSYKEGIGYSGIPYFTIASKYRFLGGRNKSYAMALSAEGNFGASAIENNIGSGENGYSVELNTSLYGGSKMGWHIMLGREKSDRKTLNVPGSLTGLTYESVTRNKIGLGLEYEMDPDLFLSLEAEGDVTTEDEDDNGLLSLGIRYQADTALAYALGLGVGLPDERSQPQIRALASITYSFGKPHAPTRAGSSSSRPVYRSASRPVRTTTTRSQPAQRTAQPKQQKKTKTRLRIAADGRLTREEYEVKAEIHNVPGTGVRAPVKTPAQARPTQRYTQPSIGAQPKVQTRSQARAQPQAQPRVQKLDPVPVQKTKPAPRRQYVSNIRIEVWNASGIGGLGNKVANHLKQKGYNVVRVKTAKRKQKQSMIFYAPGYAKQAVKVGHSIWKDQDVRGTNKLKNNIEVQVVVGYDLKN